MGFVLISAVISVTSARSYTYNMYEASWYGFCEGRFVEKKPPPGV